MKKKSIAIRLGVVAMALTMITTSLSSGTLAKFSTTVTGTSEFVIARWNVGAEFLRADGSTTWINTSNPTEIGQLASTIDDKKTNDGDGENLDTNSGAIAPGTHGKFVIKVSDAKTIASGATDDRTQVKTNYKVYIKRTDNNLGLAAPANFTMQKQGKEGEALTPVKLVGDEDIDGSATGKRKKALEDEIADLNEAYDPTYGMELASGTFKPSDAAADKHTQNITVLWDWPYAPTQNAGESDDAYKARVTAYDEADTAATSSAANLDKIQFKVYVVFTQDPSIDLTLPTPTPAGT